MRPKYALHRAEQQRHLLDQLIAAKLNAKQGTSERYALFFVTGDGMALPSSTSGDDIEQMSGFVVDGRGCIFAFELGWDAALPAPALVMWEQVEPDPSWSQSAEYHRALEQVGLPVA